MKRFLLGYAAAGLLALLTAGPSWAQKSGPPTPPSSQPGNSASQPSQPNPSSTGQSQPVYINGRVALDNGQAVPERIPVSLFCGMRQVQAIDTDAKGYFQFTLGAGPQSNFDLSASDDDTFGDGTGPPGSLSGLTSSSGNLLSCELRISLSGYEPMSKLITDPGGVGGIDAGTLPLHRLASVQGSAISVTSMLVPAGARKEFEQGEKDLRDKHLAPATQHLEKAVAQYDKFAAAWNELGRVYASGHQMDKAQQAFGKAITADPQYIPPYVALAGLQMQQGQYQSAVDNAGKALALDPGTASAGYVQALGYFKLNRLDDAEKSAQAVENGPHQNMPQLRVLLAQIYVQKRDYPNAVNEMRAYLKESPQGPLAPEVKKNLEGLEKFMSGSDAAPATAAAPPQPQPQPTPSDPQ